MLPTSSAHRNESGIVNLDDATGPGIHWVDGSNGIRRVSFEMQQHCPIHPSLNISSTGLEKRSVYTFDPRVHSLNDTT